MTPPTRPPEGSDERGENWRVRIECTVCTWHSASWGTEGEIPARRAAGAQWEEHIRRNHRPEARFVRV